ncbi:MAG TPA: hypothetical protein PLS22_15590, partial [Aquabacterium sp.]|nr:hypothetical protein [Aquabacterium sp.]
DTEYHVQQSINALGNGRFIITHRQHSLSPGDEVYMLWGGELMKKSEFDERLAAATHGQPIDPTLREFSTGEGSPLRENPGNPA